MKKSKGNLAKILLTLGALTIAGTILQIKYSPSLRFNNYDKSQNMSLCLENGYGVIFSKEKNKKYETIFAGGKDGSCLCELYNTVDENDRAFAATDKARQKFLRIHARNMKEVSKAEQNQYLK